MINQNPDIKLIFSLVIVGIVWGTTYLGIRIAVETIPPWFITSIRQGIAALIVLGILLYKRQLSWIGWNNFKIQFLLSVLMLVFANGFTTIAEQTVPSGLTSIMSALSPVVIFLGSIVFKLQRPSWRGLFGVLLGFSGVLFIFRNGLSEILDPDYKIGILFLSIAILSWSTGVLYSKNTLHHLIILHLIYFINLQLLQ